uniref:60kDa polyprotein homolog protein n=1 Tax=Abalone asfa-like virus TaxID=2839893 RepID=A0A5K7XY38_9VIRU|nr:60kDa polyprotein homolog protein [Abalone asfa-like virus]BCY04582.1 60 kDa polyprotein [Abalone asfa-like virus]
MSGKSAKKLTKFCRILPWIKQKDEEFATAIQDLCMDYNLKPARNIGVTFLYPKAKELREAIINKTYSDQATEATELINKLIIPIFIPNGDFAISNPIGNRFGTKFEVKDTTKEKIILSNGAVLVKAKDYNPLWEQSLACVWYLESGDIPSTGDSFTPPKFMKKGGYDADQKIMGPKQINPRARLAVSVERLFHECMTHNRCKSGNPYLAKTVSLLAYLQKHHYSIFESVLPIIDRDPCVCFYLLLEPYKRGPDGYLIPTSVLFGEHKWNGAELYDTIVNDYEQFFIQLPNFGVSQQARDPKTQDFVVPKMYEDSQIVKGLIQNEREKLLNANVDKLTTPGKVHVAYNTLISKNEINGLAPIFEDNFVTKISPAKKLWQDEFRFTVHAVMKELITQATYTFGDFREVLKIVRELKPGNNYNQELEFANVDAYKGKYISPKQRFALLLAFINSTDFLYVPAPIFAEGFSGGASNYDFNDNNIINNEQSKQMALEHFSKEKQVSKGLSADIIAGLKHYRDIKGVTTIDLTTL